LFQRSFPYVSTIFLDAGDASKAGSSGATASGLEG
jgi:hypothetical protein